MDRVVQLKLPLAARKLRSLNATSGLPRTAAKAYMRGVRVIESMRPVALQSLDSALVRTRPCIVLQVLRRADEKEVNEVDERGQVLFEFAELVRG